MNEDCGETGHLRMLEQGVVVTEGWWRYGEALFPYVMTGHESRWTPLRFVAGAFVKNGGSSVVSRVRST